MSAPNKLIRPYLTEDLDKIKIDLEISMKPMLDLFDERAMVSGTTLILDDEIYAIGGVQYLWNGVGEAWVLVSENRGEFPIMIFKEITKFLKNSMEHYDRVQAMVRCDHSSGIKFAEKMGFKIEGTLRKFGIDGSDHYIMARIRGD